MTKNVVFRPPEKRDRNDEKLYSASLRGVRHTADDEAISQKYVKQLKFAKLKLLIYFNYIAILRSRGILRRENIFQL